ncbi:L-seryl-tRNA(Sec) selenium transferase [Corynebacterium uberis]|uniref:L-seryl-tRNA(Sec) selenium transferase n=1 Tax=Corynebacterium uberis TaxID=2883169 RepID=UPI00237C75F4|nr:L-seryl-tRNA(Sec) selenium transferase [Corynebacterium sp. c6VSa_13]
MGVSPSALRSVIHEAQAAARAGRIAPEEVAARVRARLGEGASISRVLNATGVVVHTNLGRAPLSPSARQALIDAAGYTDVELDLASGTRSSNRGAGAREALLQACPAAEDALVVNNGAAALLLATALAGGEVVISRGELIEIGAGFRLPELIESTGVRLREVGATNRTHPQDYVVPGASAILKVHPSNYVVRGFTASVDVEQLREIADAHGQLLIVDVGSGLLRPDAVLPEEPDIDSALRAGADVVIASGDKLLGGPQAGLMLGRAEVIRRAKKHPLARALRMDKLRLAALEATVRGGSLVAGYLRADTRARTEALAARLGARVVEHQGRVGGGGAPEVPLPGWAVALDQGLATHLRALGVLPRVRDGECLVDLRCIPAEDDERLAGLIDKAREAQARQAQARQARQAQPGQAPARKAEDSCTS